MDQLNQYNWHLSLFNDLTIYIELIIASGVLYFITLSVLNKHYFGMFKHWLALEMIWTLSPILILIILGAPSLKMLYLSEIYNFSSLLSLKVNAHQWYWEYSLPEFDTSMVSYPLDLNNLLRGGEAEMLLMPFKTKIRILMTSQDVIHSWALPSMGLKMDACPGRLNYFSMMSLLPGKHFGQCSELCGSYHSWMPIMLEFSSSSLFMEWLKIMKF